MQDQIRKIVPISNRGTCPTTVPSGMPICGRVGNHLVQKMQEAQATAYPARLISFDNCSRAQRRRLLRRLLLFFQCIV